MYCFINALYENVLFLKALYENVLFIKAPHKNVLFIKALHKNVFCIKALYENATDFYTYEDWLSAVQTMEVALVNYYMADQHCCALCSEPLNKTTLERITADEANIKTALLGIIGVYK